MGCQWRRGWGGEGVFEVKQRGSRQAGIVVRRPWLHAGIHGGTDCSFLVPPLSFPVETVSRMSMGVGCHGHSGAQHAYAYYTKWTCVSWHFEQDFIICAICRPIFWKRKDVEYSDIQS